MIRRVLSLAASLLPAAVASVAAAAAVCVDTMVLRTGCAESSFVETLQLACLLVSGGVAACAAARRPDLRGGFALVSGFFFAMAVREMDGILDKISHGCWVYPALAVTAAAVAVAVRNRESVLPALERIRGEGRFQMLSIGLFAVLCFSRVVGYKGVWMATGDYGHLHAAKRMAEESTELFGYSLIACWAVMFFASYAFRHRDDAGAPGPGKEGGQ